MSDASIKMPAFTAAQHVEMLRLGVNPATVEVRRLKAQPVREWDRENAYLRADWNPTYYFVPIIDRDAEGFTIILATGEHFRVATPPGHPLRLEGAGR